jgi:hypothetical protein
MNAFILCITVALAAPSQADVSSDARVRAALSQRHMSVSCRELATWVDDPAALFAHIADTTEAPPWMPLRAAGCLMSYPDQARPLVETWVADPKRAGLADVALTSLDQWPQELATPVAREALSGPHVTLARKRLAASAHPKLQDLSAASSLRQP